METKHCQSCMMPLPSQKAHGTNSDGSYNADFCHHCYKNGQFTAEMTMDEMIAVSIRYVIDHYGSEEKAREAYKKAFPALKRWKK